MNFNSLGPTPINTSYPSQEGDDDIRPEIQQTNKLENNADKNKDYGHQYLDSYKQFDQEIIKFFSTSTANSKEAREPVKWIDLLTKFKNYLLSLKLSDALKKLVESLYSFAVWLVKSPYTIPKNMIQGFMGAPWQFQVFFVIAGIGIVTTMMPLVTKADEIFVAEPPGQAKSSEEEIKERMAYRATLASILTGLTIGSFNFAIDSVLNVSGATSTVFIGFLLGNTVGYILDIALSTEEGFYMIRQGNWRGALKNAFGVLASGTFTRFILTVLLDTFISSIIFTLIYEYVKGRFLWAREHESFVNAMLSTTIGIITFQAYTNKTRLSYAYPDISSKEDWTSSILLSLATIIAGLVFLITPKMFEFYKSQDGSTFAVIPKYGVEGIENPVNKLYLILFTVVLITIMYFNGWLEPNVPQKPTETEMWMGRVIFAVMTLLTVWFTGRTAVKVEYTWFFTLLSMVIAGAPFMLG